MRLLRRQSTAVPKQTTFVYCPTCGLEQCSSNSFVKDTDWVYYRCVKCGTETMWDFDTPVPILLTINGKDVPND